VEDARAAYEIAAANGARGALAPQLLHDAASHTSQTVAEVALYGDVVLRFVSGSFQARPGASRVLHGCLLESDACNAGAMLETCWAPAAAVGTSVAAVCLQAASGVARWRAGAACLITQDQLFLENVGSNL